MPTAKRLLCSLFVFYLSLFASPTLYAQEKLKVKILEQQSHDAKTFTQGLFFADGKLYESSGLYGRSFLRVYQASDNTPLLQTKIHRSLFAEGLTVTNGEIYMLTWRAGRLLRFNASTLTPKTPWAYKGEGWGLTHSKDYFFMSNGSHEISLRDLKSFKEVKRIEVKNAWRKFSYLNELEFVDGYLYANIWQSPYIVKIDAESGEVTGIADLTALVKQNSKTRDSDVLNGIAYDAARNAFWVTGKLWPNRYLVQFSQADNQSTTAPEPTAKVSTELAPAKTSNEESR